MIRKKMWVCIFCLLFLVCLSGCSNSPAEKTAENKLVIYTSFYPLYDFSKKIAGDKAEVINMVPVGVEPHEWEPTTKDIVNLNNADLFVYNGLNMEQWADKVINSLQGKKPQCVETAAGLSADGLDPHIWLNPLLAAEQMRKIKEALCQIDPANTKQYEQNYAENKALLEKLDEEYKEGLALCQKKELIVAHQAFGYLCQAYGLKQIAIQGLSAENEPNPKHIKEIIDFIKRHQVKVIFGEELVSPKLTSSLAQEAGCKVEILNTLEGLSQEEKNEGKEYFAVMRDNLKKIKAALQ